MPPCDLLTADQARDLDIDLTTAKSASPGAIPGCLWSSPGFTFSVGVKVDTTMGLANLYGSHVEKPYKRFEPMQIDGYPAVRAENSDSGLDCTIYVGLAETQTMWVMGTDQRGGDSCVITRPVITAMLANLPPLR